LYSVYLYCERNVLIISTNGGVTICGNVLLKLWNIVVTAWQFVNCVSKACTKKLRVFLSTSINCMEEHNMWPYTDEEAEEMFNGKKNTK